LQTFATVFYVGCNSSAKYTAFTHIRLAWLYRGADKSLARPGRKQAQKHVRDVRDFNNIETQAVIKFFFPLQGKEPKEIHTILTETLASFLPGRAKDLSAPLYCDTVAEILTVHYICAHSVLLGTLFYCACTKEKSPLNGPCWYIAQTVTLSPPYLASAVILFSPLHFPPFHSSHLVILFTWTLVLITTWKPSLLTCSLGWLPGTSGSW